MFKVRIRGIYSTALARLAIDKGYKIVQPTPAIVERLGLEVDNGPPDITVKDHESKAGVIVLGKCDATSAFLSTLRETLDPFIAEADMGVHEIFAGRVEEGGLVRTPKGALAEVPRRYVVYPGVRLFTVVKPPVGPNRAVAVPELILDGDFVELTTEGGIKFSEHIGEEDRLRLRILAEKLSSSMPGLGIRFKSSAKFAEEEAIAEEVKRLYNEVLEISSRAWAEGEVARRGSCFAVVLFDKWGRERLDEIRASAAPTARAHHALRMQGLGKCVDLLDAINADGDKALAHLARGRVRILHIKPWGDTISMEGEVTAVKGDVWVIKRRLRPGGILDGIGVRIERGFYALTCVKPGAALVVHSYYDAGGNHIGDYININTPVELGRRIYYIDLLVDKAVGVSGEAKTLDLDELEKYRRYFPDRYKSAEALLPQGALRCTPDGLIEAGPH
ncbi:MAG: DUF402 domain-containing protein [Thermoproteus sp. AZ2]|jgi:Ribonuclease G/E|uniref:DUF402 domain-containing protein n=1 Tax=Thermoproteus sp. AZ2 TaxID=1609232 RepID=A0ACC6V1B0_9CREN